MICVEKELDSSETKADKCTKVPVDESNWFAIATQTIILTLTVCAALYQNCDDVVQNGIAYSYVTALFILLTMSNSQHPFEIVYSFFIPWGLSYMFNRPLCIINLILTLNVTSKNRMLVTFGQLSSCYLSGSNPGQCIIAIILNATFAWILEIVGQLKSLDRIDCNLFSILLTNVFYLITATRPESEMSSIPFKIVQGTLGAFVCTAATDGITAIFANSAARLPATAAAFPLFTHIFLQMAGVHTPLLWLADYIYTSDTRLTIFGSWLTLVAIAVPTFMIFFQSSVSLNTSRKVWHFLIFLMIVIPFNCDQTFVKIALAGMIPLFLSTEYIRYMRLEPIGELLEAQRRPFADGRDNNGPLIVSYIYLILGISFPLLVFNSPVGLVSLGIGDSLASIVGKKIGKYRWPGSSKTIEGTIAFVFSTFVACKLLQACLGYFHGVSSITIFAMCFLSAILEGNSSLNDNILIPSFMLICEKAFASASSC